MPQGAYDATKAYTINNLVAMYGMSFLANGDVAAGYAPAQLNQDGTVSLINTDKWTLFAGDPSAYNMKQYFDDTVEQITALIANKANIDGWYSTLTVGAAENLVGRGTTPAVISFRPAGGTQDIGSGAASIAKIKGRTDAWNQSVMASMLRSSGTSNGITYTNNGDGSLRIVGTAEANGNILPFGTTVTFLASHKYFLINAGSGSISVYASPIGFGINTTGKIFACESTQTPSINRSINAGESIDMLFIPKIIDLTLLYGAGREPATVAAFLAEYPEALTAPFNLGVLVPNKVTALVTDGFNQWDEQWELGEYDTSTGQKKAGNTTIRCVNLIRVMPNTNYYCSNGTVPGVNGTIAMFYDANESLITNIDNGRNYSGIGNILFTTPSNAAFMSLYTAETTYNNDLAINLSHSGIRNGEYEPYWTATHNIDHSKIYGKLNGAGEMVQIAPYGFRGVGGNYDEVDVVKKEAYIRRAWVDMGTLTWTYESGSGLMYAPIANIVDPGNPRRVPLACAKYTGIYDGCTLENTPDKSIFNRTTPNLGVMVKDSAYTDAAAFKTAMNGVMLDYQLATPLRYTDLMYSEDGGQTFTEIPSNYRVDDFGTERRLPDGLVDGAPASTPLVAEIAYAMNAVDPLRNLPRNYLSKQSTENLLAAMQSAGIIAGYTMTYDEDNAEYDFTITAPAGA